MTYQKSLIDNGMFYNLNKNLRYTSVSVSILSQHEELSTLHVHT